MSEIEVSSEQIAQEQEVINSVKPEKRDVIKAQLRESREFEALSIKEKLRREIEYLDSVNAKPGVLVSVVSNETWRKAPDGRTYKSRLNRCEYVRYLPLQTQMAQPGYAQRLLRKGLKVLALYRKDDISEFLKALSKSDGGEQYLQNIELFELEMKNGSFIEQLKKDSEAKDAEISELRRKVEELSGSSNAVKPKGIK